MTTPLEAFENQLNSIQALDKHYLKQQAKKASVAASSPITEVVRDETPERLVEMCNYIYAKQSLFSTGGLAKGLAFAFPIIPTILSLGTFGRAAKQTIDETTRDNPGDRKQWRQTVTAYESRYRALSLPELMTRPGQPTVLELLNEMITHAAEAQEVARQKLLAEYQVGRTIAQVVGLEPPNDPATLARDQAAIEQARSLLTLESAMDTSPGNFDQNLTTGTDLSDAGKGDLLR